MESLRLAFMGTPDFAVPTLAELVACGHDIAAVYTQPPKPAGRGHGVKTSPVHRFAQTLNLTVHTPKTLKDPAEQDAFADLNLDVAVVVAYGQILPKPVLEAPRLGCVNLHASLLPRWRGAAPIQRAIMAGDGVTGVTVMQMEEGLDTGPMLLMEQTPIEDRMTAGELHDKLAKIGAELMPRALSALARGALVPTVQSEAGVTYAAKIDKADARIDWARPAAELDCHIRGLSPFPGAWFELPMGDRTIRIKVLRATPVDKDGAPGEILDDQLTVACGKGALRILDLQREGKKAAKADAFLRGTHIPPGTILPKESMPV